jgi:hypothetical protein
MDTRLRPSSSSSGIRREVICPVVEDRMAGRQLDDRVSAYRRVHDHLRRQRSVPCMDADRVVGPDTPLRAESFLAVAGDEVIARTL